MNLKLTVTAIVFAGLLGFADRTWAQLPFSPYSSLPSPAPTPALSPWLNMSRADPGPAGLGPYLSYVRPEQRLLNTLSLQQNQMLRQENQIRAQHSRDQTQIAQQSRAAQEMRESIRKEQESLRSLRNPRTGLSQRGARSVTGIGGGFTHGSHFYRLK